MLARNHSVILSGLDARKVEIEVNLSGGWARVIMVGLLDTAAKESRDRVEAAIKNSGFIFPDKKITVNFAPADIKKEGSLFDLPLALGILASSAQINSEKMDQFVILGELSLKGELRSIKGALAIAASLAKESGQKIILPSANAAEAAIAGNVEIYPVRNLFEAVAFLEGHIDIKPYKRNNIYGLGTRLDYDADFSEVKGQNFIKRALEVAVAGAHNILFVGPPGAGKTMLAKRIPTIFPAMEIEEMIEVTKIYSIAGLLPKGVPVISRRPFRNPHHTASGIALVGGGTTPSPGEVSLAHNGVLFLDELPEFRRDALEALRQPLEDKKVVISRARGTLEFPARFLLVATMNPCPCGYYGSRGGKVCHCSYSQIDRYRKKISGPLLDRIDIQVEVPALSSDDLLSFGASSETSKEIKKRVETARIVQIERFKHSRVLFNAHMNHSQVRKFCHLSVQAKDILRRAIDSMGLSARAYGKIIKVSRTIADMDRSLDILPEHISEAVRYRSLDRDIWI